MRIRTICRCDEQGKPAGYHEPDCPLVIEAYQEFVRLNLRPDVKRVALCDTAEKKP
jgi:hypothetical protein